MHTITKRIIFVDKFDAATGKYETYSCRLAIRDSLVAVGLRSSVARLPSCF